MNRESEFAAGAVALVCAFCHRFRDLMGVLEEHLEDNDGQVLAHPLMSDCVRWMVATVESRPADVQAMVDWLDEAFELGDDREKEVLWQSMVDMLPTAPGERGVEIRRMLGPNLTYVAAHWRVCHTPAPPPHGKLPPCR